MTPTTLFRNRKGLTDLGNKLMVAEGRRGEGAVRGFGIHVYTPPYLKWVTDKDLLTGQHRELCSKLRGLLDGKGAWGRVDTCVRLSEFLCCPPQAITILFSARPQYKIKSFKKRNVIAVRIPHLS